MDNRLISLLWLACLLVMPLYAQAESTKTPSITLYMTVDWEGIALEEENLQAMREFRHKHPEIPMLHLLNPVYFLHPGVDAADTAHKIKSTLLPADGHGLHLHGWKSLIEHCELPYRSEPTFSGLPETCESGDCGYSVSLEYAYSEYELTTLLGCSAQLLVQHGFNQPTSFRAGGWQMGPKMAKALLNNRFTFDSSRTAPHLVANRWDKSSNLMQMVTALHGDSTILDQPFELLPGLTEYPNNASLADYTRTEEIVEIFKALVANGKTVMVLGFHQESAFNYLDRLADAIVLMQQEADAAAIRLQWAKYQ